MHERDQRCGWTGARSRATPSRSGSTTRRRADLRDINRPSLDLRAHARLQWVGGDEVHLEELSADQGEWATDREARDHGAATRIRRLRGESHEPLLGRSRLAPERATPQGGAISQQRLYERRGSQAQGWPPPTEVPWARASAKGRTSMRGGALVSLEDARRQKTRQLVLPLGSRSETPTVQRIGEASTAASVNERPGGRVEASQEDDVGSGSQLPGCTNAASMAWRSSGILCRMTSSTRSRSTPKYSCASMFRMPRIRDHGIAGRRASMPTRDSCAAASPTCSSPRATTCANRLRNESVPFNPSGRATASAEKARVTWIPRRRRDASRIQYVR